MGVPLIGGLNCGWVGGALIRLIPTDHSVRGPEVISDAKYSYRLLRLRQALLVLVVVNCTHADVRYREVTRERRLSEELHDITISTIYMYTSYGYGCQWKPSQTRSPH